MTATVGQRARLKNQPDVHPALEKGALFCGRSVSVTVLG